MPDRDPPPGGGSAAASDADGTVAALTALGVDEAEARDAVARGAVPLVLVRQLLAEDRRHTLDELAAAAGVDAGILGRVFRALGAGPDERYGEQEVEEARKIGRILEVLPEETVVRLARLRGMAVSRIASGDLNAVRDQLIAPMREAGADDLAVAVQLAEAAKALLPVSTDLLVAAHRRAVLNVLSSEVASVVAREGGQQVDLAVGFVDLVGYTALSARVDPEGLDDVLEAFEQRVVDVVGGDPRVTLVKFLGDAAMLISADAAVLAATLLELATPWELLEESPLRAGMSAGPTLVREGDYYGAPVNMAARLTDHARPWTLLADEHLRADLDPHFRVHRIRPVRLRGVGVCRPLAVKFAAD